MSSLEGNQLAGGLVLAVHRRNRGTVCSKTPSCVSNLLVLVSGFAETTAKRPCHSFYSPTVSWPHIRRTIFSNFTIKCGKIFFSVWNATMLDVLLVQAECITFTAIRSNTHKINSGHFSICMYSPDSPVWHLEWNKPVLFALLFLDYCYHEQSTDNIRFSL